MENIKSSLINIKSHPLRTILTLLGISIGVFAVISLSSLVLIVKSTIKQEMKDLGWNNSITVYASDNSHKFRFRRRHFSRRLKRFMYLNRKSSPLTLKDFYDIKNNVPNRFCYAIVTSSGYFSMNGKKSKEYLVATNYDYLKLNKYKIIHGRFFNDLENNKHIKVCILSKVTAKDFSKNPKELIGKTIKFKNNTFRIIGIAEKEKKKSTFVRFGTNQDYEEKNIFIPLTTGIFYFRKSTRLDRIYIQAPSKKVFNKMKNQLRQILLRNHNMAHDFSFMDVGSFMLKINNEIDTQMKKWSILFITIATVSLLVGGIGLFSTLIISITERMNEIGIRKSVGAKNSDIFMLFISEALILAILAGTSGFILSDILVKILSKALKQSYQIPIEGILLGFGFSVLIGFLSGLYPAIKAAKINPTQAIYYFQ